MLLLCLPTCFTYDMHESFLGWFQTPYRLQLNKEKQNKKIKVYITCKVSSSQGYCCKQIEKLRFRLKIVFLLYRTMLSKLLDSCQLESNNGNKMSFQVLPMSIRTQHSWLQSSFQDNFPNLTFEFRYSFSLLHSILSAFSSSICPR